MKAFLPLSSFQTPRFVLFAAGVLFYLLILAFGDSPQANGLDPAWTEVLAWGFLNHAKWGSNLVYMYGPLGFLHPYSSYVSGVFPAFVAGQIALPAAFVLAILTMLRRARPVEFAFFALAFVCCFYRWPGDVSWLLTLLFSTVCLINGGRHGNGAPLVMIALVATVFAAIALTKFSALPFAVLCLGIASLACMLQRNWRHAMLLPLLFLLALVSEWIACDQDIGDLPKYVASGLEFSYGYRHAMGQRAPVAIEVIGLAALFVFLGASLHVAWRARSNRVALAAISLAPTSAAFLWVAYFTRADEFHWPGYFAAMALLPFTLLCSAYFVRSRAGVILLLAVTCVCASMSFLVMPVDSVPQAAFERIRSNLGHLLHLSELRDEREKEWQALADSEALPKIRARVGHARIDMITWQQETILLNGLNYSPRPVFQSHVAYTPRLARVNESYFLGQNAPDFVLFRLDASDNRLPMSEDGLALLALLKRYRPALFEKSFLLLQRDASIAPADALSPPAATTRFEMGATIPVDAIPVPSAAFIDVELNAFGKLYTLFFPEPALGITIGTSAGETLHFKLVRLTASAGFLANPVVQSARDWLSLYFFKPLASVHSLRIDSELPWERLLFRSDLALAWRQVDVLRADSSSAPVDLRNALYPGFNLEPAATRSPLRIVTEDGQESIFLHAPASLSFSPPPGHYRISATYGIQGVALTDPSCAKADPDGVGVSLVLRHGGRETQLWHDAVDPFHQPQERGAHRLSMYGDIGAGDSLDYRVDTGIAGTNSNCDWSYLRDLRFVRSTDADYERVYTNGFE